MLDDNDTNTTDTTTPDTPAPDAPDSPTTDLPAGSATSDGPAGGSGSDGPTSEGHADADHPVTDAPPAAKKTARKTATRKTAAKRTTKKATAADDGQPTLPAADPTDSAGDAAATGDPTLAGTPDTGTTSDADLDGTDAAPVKKAARKTAAKKTTAKKATAKRTSKKAAASSVGAPTAEASERAATTELDPAELDAPQPDATAPVAPATGATSPDAPTESAAASTPDAPAGTDTEDEDAADGSDAAQPSVPVAPSLLFRAPDPAAVPARARRSAAASEVEPDAQPDVRPDSRSDTGDEDVAAAPDDDETGTSTETDADDETDTDDEQGGNRRRRRRGGRRRRRSGSGDDAPDGPDGSDAAEDADDEQPAARTDDKPDTEEPSQGGGRGGRGGRGSAKKQSGQKASTQQGADKAGPDDSGEADDQGEGTGSRRRRRRRRTGEEAEGTDEPGTVTRVRKPRNAEDEITALHGSTRLEAKKQRRREGREAGRRRAPIVSEAEFLARREAVDRVMVIRQRADLTQIAVLEDKVLVEHYVARESQTSLIGNVYLGRVQNVLPSMEAAFIDIGKGRNAVLYAGEVNWDSLGAGNGPRKIESVLKSGQPILVQVSKDPIGHKGARLTSQISLPGRFLVYVPDGTTSGISRKLPDTERSRLKTLLKEIVPDSAGVIVRTAAEGASEEELTLDVERLTARWSDIEGKVAQAPKTGGAPQLLYGEPDLTLKVVRDLFTEDFAKLVVSGDDAWGLVDSYVKHVASDLEDRLERYSDDAEDVFAAYRIDEQIAKGLDRKVWLPSGGSLVIDRTEAMTVVDVNTGKFTGSGGNLEETVTKNNLEAAEEMVRQLRLRDIGGIIVIDFIDMVLESNRDLVLRRLVECLGRDRTRHQVAEVTSLGLVQMTRKRIGTGLLEAFSETCEHCQGRGLIVQHEPVEASKRQDDEPRRGRRGRRGGEGDSNGNGSSSSSVVARPPSPKDIAAMAKHDHRQDQKPVEVPVEEPLEALVDEPVEPVVVSEEPEPLEPLDAPEPLVAPEQMVAPEPIEAPEASPVDEPSVAVAPAVAEQVSEPVTVPESTAIPEAAAVTDTPEEPAAPVPTGPVVVTSTRRRVARRPAGSAVPSSPSTHHEPTVDHAPRPEPAVLQPAAAQPVAAPAGPVLVTSTRRRVIRRPAGPPVGTLSGDGSGGGSDGTAGESEPDPEEAHLESAHVPVKKKGSRKR